MRNRPTSGQTVIVPAGRTFYERGACRRANQDIEGKVFSVCGLNATIIDATARYFTADWRFLEEPVQLATRDFGNGTENLIGRKIVVTADDTRTGSRQGRIVDQLDLGEALKLRIKLHKVEDLTWMVFPIVNRELRGCQISE